MIISYLLTSRSISESMILHTEHCSYIGIKILGVVLVCSVSLTQTRLICEKGTSAEELSPVGMIVGKFLYFC